jgi:hypothetical protein
MTNYYLDFVGLNTFIYEAVVYDILDESEQQNDIALFNQYWRVDDPDYLNHIGPRLSGLITHGAMGLPYFKNYVFSHDLPSTASFFPALMLHRNGPYGYPMWKQIRVGQNPLTRKQIKHNIFTHVVEPGNEFEFTKKGVTQYAKNKYGNIEPFDEMCLTSRFSPIQIDYRDSTIPGTNFKLKVSVGNNIQHFNSEKLDLYYDLYTCEDKNYNRVKKLYLDKTSNSRMDNVDYLTYSETIYPQARYTYKSYVRQRTQFIFNWRDSRADRTRTEDFHFYDPSDYPTVQKQEDNRYITQSMWPMDVSSDWDTRTGDFIHTEHGYRINVLLTAPANHKDFGILQNSVSRYNYVVGGIGLAGLTDTSGWIKPSPLYFWHHMIPHSRSVVSSNGMLIEGINHGTTMGDISGNYVALNRAGALPSGETKWEANDTRMILNSSFEYVSASRNPFYDTYDQYVSDIRLQYKNYSIIPEFRSSLFMKENIVGSGINKYDIFQISGGLKNTTDSDKDNFYKIFSNSDFMKHFDVIRKEHKDIMDIDEITLSCKAVMKFLPYEGFYPVERTVELAKAFYSDTKDRVVASSGAVSAQRANAIQNIVTPMFAPGVLYNTIKSGIACDYAVVTGSAIAIENRNVIQNSSSHGEYFSLYSNKIYTDEPQNVLFDHRVHFKALIEPEKYLKDKEFYSNVPHRYGNLSASVRWDGAGALNYKLMAHNFLSEVPEFFLENKTFTSHASLPSNDPNFGNLSKNNVYYMRVSLYKTVDGVVESEHTGAFPKFAYQTPQYKKIHHGGANESFTMYSRPSAFGPPARLDWVTGIYTGSHDPEEGENYVFTPPYYYGAGWADIKFEPSETKKYTIYEILEGASASYYRYHNKTILGQREKGKLINKVGMNVDASVNLFGIGKVQSDKITVDSNEVDAQWIIQPWFETPMLNFNHLSSSQSITLPLEGSQSVARGMWHQYGLIEKDPAKGIKFAIEEIPDRWHLNAQEGTGFAWGAAQTGLQSGSKGVRNLADHVGFGKDHKTLGKLATTKRVKEAIVAVPFVEVEGERKFFKISRTTLMAVEAMQNTPGNMGAMAGVDTVQYKGLSEHISKLYNQMETYIFPPSMNFIHNKDIDPFAMYVFEFEHTFDQQDLADMWQNLPPNLGHQFTSTTSTISHKHLKHELLGGGGTISMDGTTVIEEPAQGEFPDRVKWMVFKVKQRAESNFYKKMIGEAGGNSTLDPNTGESVAGYDVLSNRVNNLQYNWPYDFFSMIELVNIEASVTMKNPNYDPTMQATLDTTQPAQGAQQAAGMGPGDMQNIGTGTGPKTEVGRFYTPWPVDKTIVLYDDGTKESLSGNQT